LPKTWSRAPMPESLGGQQAAIKAALEGWSCWEEAGAGGGIGLARMLDA